MLKYVKNVGLILVILGHYYFCSYVLEEVHEMKNYEPKIEIGYNTNNTDDKNIKEEKQTVENTLKVNTSNDYLAVIEIPKISLRRYLYDVNSKQNDVDKNIEILKNSDMPSVKGGNLILAGHNGNTSVGHFKNLHKLVINDEIIIYYNNIKYVYKVSKIYDVLKTGTVAIKRDKSQNTVTLITCLGNDRQLVVIGYLSSRF